MMWPGAYLFHPTCTYHTTRNLQDYFRTLLYTMGWRISRYLALNFKVKEDAITSITICGERVGRVVPQANEFAPQSSEPEASGTNPSGTNPSGTNPSGTKTSGTNPSGTKTSGSESRCEMHSAEVRVDVHVDFVIRLIVATTVHTRKAGVTTRARACS